MLHGIGPGELDHWLGVIDDNGRQPASPQAVPDKFIDLLANLKCISQDAGGQWRLTD